MASSPSPSDSQIITHSAAPDSALSSVLYDLSQQVQVGRENMLKIMHEIDQHSAEIMDDIEKCKDSALQRKKTLKEEKDRCQKAAYTVLDMLNYRD